MSDLRQKTLDFAVKAMGESGTFELYAAVFGNVDRQGEVIAPGAFKNLDAFVKDGWGAVNHRAMDLPTAMIDAAGQDGTGLRIVGTFHSHQAAQDCRTVVRERMAAGKSVKCSIGFRVVEGATETRDGKAVYVLKSVEVFEFSFVNLPANPAAEVTSVKSATPEAPPLVPLEAARSLVDRIKAGRAISRPNREKLAAWAEGLDRHGKAACAMAGELKAFLDAHEPATGDDPDAEPDADPDDDGAEKTAAAALAARRQTLRHRGARLRSTLVSLSRE